MASTLAAHKLPYNQLLSACTTQQHVRSGGSLAGAMVHFRSPQKKVSSLRTCAKRGTKRFAPGGGLGLQNAEGGQAEGEAPPAAAASTSVDDDVASKPVGASAPTKVPTITIEDLMSMIKDAEKNILMLNRVRMRAVEELEHAKTENGVLKGQLDVLKARLAESEAKVKLAMQSKAKNQILEEQVAALQARVSEMDQEMRGMAETAANNKMLQDQVSMLQSQLEAAQSRVEQVLVGQEEKQRVTEEALNLEVSALRSQLAEAESKLAQLMAVEKEKERLKEKTTGLEERITELGFSRQQAEEAAEVNSRLKDQIRALEERVRQSEFEVTRLAKVEADGVVWQQEIQTLKGMLLSARERAESMEAAKGRPSAATEILQEQVELLKASLDEATAERDVFRESEAENQLLRSQVASLEQRLLQSDAEIRGQLALYQREIEAFEERIAEETSENMAGGIVQVPIGEMPWDFWSNLLLRLDTLTISKLLTLDEGVDLRLMAWQRDVRIRDVYVEVQDEKMYTDDEVANVLKVLVQGDKRPGMHIIHIAAEMAPVAKVGGLADVVTGLGRALQRKGHLVEFILPKYDNMDYSRIKDLKVMDQDFPSFFDGEMFKNKIWRGIVEGLPVYFLEPHHPGRFFWRGEFYGCDDDFRRFTYFCRAALEFIYKTKKKPDIIHSHDWQTAAVAPLYWDIYVKAGMDSAQIAFTCHNFEYQGTAPAGAIAACGLNPDRFHNQERMQDNFMHDKINLLKGGIVYSNIVTTVSPTYAQEVRGAEGGRGLHPTLAKHGRKFFGILNGIDCDSWNPATDPLLEFQYNADDVDGKAANKTALRERLGLSTHASDAHKPLVGCVTRLVPQKGVHLIRHSIYRTLDRGGQFVLLGSSPVPSIQRDFENIARQFERHPHIRLVLKYDETLSHSIYAASDLFVIPSMFEPCGLTQLIAMRYGSIPVARKTGGLNDSVFDVDDQSIPEQLRNGYTFSATDEQGLSFALDRALDAYYERRNWWDSLVAKVMSMDFSWDKPSDQFVELYRAALKRANPR